jgi:hypothetical protein
MKKSYDVILISRQFFGIWFEFWSEKPLPYEDKVEFFREVRERYRRKWNNKPFRMRLYYSDDYYEVTKDSVNHI